MPEIKRSASVPPGVSNQTLKLNTTAPVDAKEAMRLQAAAEMHVELATMERRMHARLTKERKIEKRQRRERRKAERSLARDVSDVDMKQRPAAGQALYRQEQMNKASGPHKRSANGRGFAKNGRGAQATVHLGAGPNQGKMQELLMLPAVRRPPDHRIRTHRAPPKGLLMPVF